MDNIQLEKIVYTSKQWEIKNNYQLLNNCIDLLV